MKITDWPSTHINLATGWAAFVLTILVGHIALLFRIDINESLYVTIIIATGAWAGVAAPMALIGKRATTKPELTVTVTEDGPPAKVTTTVTTPAQAESEPAPTTVVVKPYEPPEGAFVGDGERTMPRTSAEAEG